MRVLTLKGSPRQMGQAYGEACRDQLPEFFELRVQNAIKQALSYGGQAVNRDDVMRAAEACIEPTRQHDPRAFQELEGIAEGAHMSVAQVLATNGLTDIRDLLSWPGPPESMDGCSAMIVQKDLTESGELFCGQTWDLATDNLPFVLGVHRQPDQGPWTWSLTTVGCLSLIGLNDAGIAVGTTNVRTTDARPGVTYLSLIHKALSMTSLQQAVDSIVGAQRAGAHFYYLANALGEAVALECAATRVSALPVPSGAYAHTNHCLEPENIAIQGHEPQASSLARLDRLQALTGDTSQGLHTAEAMMGFFADGANGTNAICRDDFNGINTNGAVLMAPQSGRIWACHGLPTRDNWIDLKAP